MTVAGQDAADGISAFTLGLRPAAGSPATWAFRYGATTLTGRKVSVGGRAHLTGLYDTEDDTLRLYVNGKEVASETGVVPVSAPGAFQTGRARGDGGARRQGEIGDVRVRDRVVPREEIEELGFRPAEPAAAWDIERTDDGAIPDRDGDKPLTLHGGAGFCTPTTMPASKTPSASSSRRAPSTATTT
jgi:hypothetical protein